ncbi:long-chain fatty acid--CoA ligase [Oceanispirochaeta crateris]|uniref:Long-chain fatty acid--CoA ligase n=1 Tax=Oceanispirochaeta crateris TaxID=2518645 RepID=A0A5C1QLY6_9SPIO|nr:AMP-binding protein [Oceanispirochaeta crateris]QEN07990.1 long-chain fatty acid--CoA ligase [Oceanispirochaeta crateris]
MNLTPWEFLPKYKGKYFNGTWPTLPEVLEITVERYGERRAFTAYSPELLELTYKDVLEKSKIIGQYLHSHGVRKGHRVGVTGKNSPEWGLAYLGILFAGGVVVPLDYGLSNGEVEKLMEMADVDILFCDEEKYDFFQDKNLKNLIALSPKKENYVLHISHDGDETIDMPQEDDLAAILFTSGTTGVSKGVMLTHSNFVSDAYQAQANMNIFHTDVFYALLPLHHSYSMLAVFIESLCVGSEIVFAKHLAIAQILKDLKQGQVTMFLGVPMLFNKMIKGLMKGIRDKGIVVYGLILFLMWISGLIKKYFHVNPGKKMFKGLLAKLSLDTNRVCICGGGPLPASTFKMFNQLGIDFVQGYGLTETSPIVALNPKEAYKEDSVGKMIPGTQTKILDPDERGCGEIALKGSMVMRGYYKNDEATREVFTEDNWFKTGDVGYLDEDNYLYLTGRAKSMIVTEGGKNVFPEEIEDKFQLYDEIDQILIRGYVLDAKMKTEGIEALIYPNQDGKDLSREHFQKVIDEVNSNLKAYQKISQFHILHEAMEMTTTKKIKRHKVVLKED